MKLPFLPALIAISLAACATPSTDPQRLPDGQWSLDAAHSSVVWQVRHMGLSWYTGRFDGISAVLSFDPEYPDNAQLTAIIDAHSVSTGDADFDTVLAENWLQADRHPQIIFRSSRIDIIDDTHGRAYGALVLNGRTSEVMMEIEFYGGVFNFLEGNDAIGFGAEMMIDRNAHNIGNLPHSIVGPDVRIHIEAEFLLQDEIND